MLKKPFIRTLSALFVFAGLVACAQQQQNNSDFNTLISGKLIKADGSEAPADALKDKTVLVYFSAHWCPPCRRFTPELVKVYDQWKAEDKPVELVFVSSDQDEAAMKNYMTETGMKWLAVPHGDNERKAALARRWSIRGIPSLIVVSPAGETLTQDGVSAVYEKKAAALEAWLPKP